MLQFDAETAKLLDDGSQGSDIAQRRLANLAALAPERDNVIADVGAGTGLLTLDLARVVGETGQVIAIESEPRDARPRLGQIATISEFRGNWGRRPFAVFRLGHDRG